MRRPRSLRGRVTLAATVGLALWVAVVTVAFNVVLAHRLAAQADDVLKVRAEAAASTLGVLPTGSVVVHDTRGDAAIDVGTWIFQGRRLVEGPPLQTGLGRRASMLAGAVPASARPIRRGRSGCTSTRSAPGAVRWRPW